VRGVQDPVVVVIMNKTSQALRRLVVVTGADRGSEIETGRPVRNSRLGAGQVEQAEITVHGDGAVASGVDVIAAPGEDSAEGFDVGAERVEPGNRCPDRSRQ